MKTLLFLSTFIIYFQANGQWAGAMIDPLTQNNLSDRVNQQCIDIDLTNKLHVVYSREVPGSGQNIFYTKRDLNSVWTVEENITSQIAGNPVVVASDLTDDAYVAYDAIDSIDKEIYICLNAGGIWNCTQITRNLLDDITPSVAIDSSGNLHLTWVTKISNSNYKISYATNLSGSIQIQNINISLPGQFGSGASPKIDVEKNGIAHIVYRGNNGNGYRIHHLYNSSPGGTTWKLEYITTPNDEDLTSAIEVDKNSVVHILVTGDDCFGCTSRAFYQNKNLTDSMFSGAADVAPSFVVSSGDLFVDKNNIPNFVLNEVSGNIFTGNIIYAASTNWNVIFIDK